MAEKSEPLQGKIISPKAVDAVGAMGGLDALIQIVSAVRGAHEIHQVESTKRARLQAYEATEVARIKAGSEILRDYFDKVFTERQQVHKDLFKRLDQALESGNTESLQAVTQGIVEVARSSPLASAGDLGQVRAALDDPDQIWDL